MRIDDTTRRSRSRAALTVSAGLCLLATAALAQEAPMTPPPAATPPAELARLGQVITPGTYTCTGLSQMPGHPRHPISATVRVEQDLDGFWISGEYAEERTPENPHPLKVEEHFTFDPSTGHYVRMARTSRGGHSVLTARQLSDGQIAFSGQENVNGRLVQTRMTFMRLGPRHVRAQLFHADAQGQMVPAFQADCRH